MKIEQRKWTRAGGWTPGLADASSSSTHLVLVFGDTAILKEPQLVSQIRNGYPGAQVIGCSTAGEICGTEVSDDSVVLTAVTFEHSRICGARVRLSEVDGSLQAGAALAQALPRVMPGSKFGALDALAHVFVLSDGLKVNGSDLVAGLMRQLPEGISVTGGLAGDGDRFGETLTLWDDAPKSNEIVAVGLYGSRLQIGFGSFGGYDPFGPERLITRSKGNVLYELDGQSALGLYKKYLGDHAKGLPATGLLFPLGLRNKNSEAGLVRTILNVDETQQSMTFAGDVPEGSYARLMKVNSDRLVDGAIKAATTSNPTEMTTGPDLAILISCVGRKLVLKQRTEEEIEAVRSIFGDRTTLTGFYSYGEIAPFMSGAQCELHNQSMTITTISER